MLPRKGRDDTRGEDRWSEEVTGSLHFPSSANTHFPTTEAVLRSKVPHYRCGGGQAGSQGGSRMAGGSSMPGDAIEEILPQGPIGPRCYRGDPAPTPGRGCKRHLQFNRGDLHNFRSIEDSLVEFTQHVFL